MGWLIVIIIAAVALGSASSGAAKAGLKVSDDCKTVTEVDPIAFMKHALAVLRAEDYTTPVASRAEGEARILRMLRAAFPRCSGVVPETWDGVAWSDLIDRLWQIAQQLAQPGLEGSGAAPANAAEAIARGAPFQYEAVVATLVPPFQQPEPVGGGIQPPEPPAEPPIGPWIPVDEGE